jgi:hypothetical protein
VTARSKTNREAQTVTSTKAPARTLRLTNAVVRGLPAPERGSRITYDSDVAGFGLRVTANGARAFVLTYRVRSTQHQHCMTIGRFSNWSTAAARARARELKREIDQGGDPLADLRDEWVVTLHESVARKVASFIEQGIEPKGYLYRHYGPDGDLLYVGMTLHVWSRQKSHLKTAEWANSIYQIIIEPFASRAELIEAEALAIKSEYPKFNKVHNDRTLRRELVAERDEALNKQTRQPEARP